MDPHPTSQIHRRKSSRDAEEILESVRPSNQASPDSEEAGSRLRANSSPTKPLSINGHARPHASVPAHPPSAGPHRTTFMPNRSPSLPTPNGHVNGSTPSAYRTSVSPTNTRTSPSHTRTFSHSLSPTYIHSLNQPHGAAHAPSHLANGHASHSRTRSISTPFSPPVSSPLASSFPPQSQSFSALPTSAPATKHAFPSFSSFSAIPTSEADEIPAPVQTPSSPKPGSSRRHTRLHSRNLSIFFPRPGSLPTNSIAEDGSQEVEIQVDDIEAPVSTIPSAGSSISFPRSSRQPPTPLGAGFTFGERPPDGTSGLPVPSPMSSRSNSTGSQSHSRRGHHHKHSLSHNFFSFLEPGASSLARPNEGDLHTQPTLTPVSPWHPISPFPNTADSLSPSPSPNPSVVSELPSQNGDISYPHPAGQSYSQSQSNGLTGVGPKVVGGLQFMLGAWMWVTGQQIGSLSCTGLGYWVVFDAFGVGIGVWAGKHLQPSGDKGNDSVTLQIRRPYGNARVETVLMFAQAVYLMFSSVYVCKEAVEHLLLSAGAGAGGGGGAGGAGHSEGHHHHHGGSDDTAEFLGIDFPIFLTLLTLVSLLYTAALYGNHGKLLRMTGNRIPSFGTLLRRITHSISRATSTSRSSSYAYDYDDPPTSTMGQILSNPYIASPLFFAFALLCISFGFDVSQHHTCDLVLACLITVVTFNVAYKASVVLGTVLLQTSPPRGSSSSGRMDSFLRMIKEIERHPHVVHMPPPHIWQLTPSPATSVPVLTNGQQDGAESLVVTLELHVKEGLGDDDVLRLTKWAWEKCMASLRVRGREPGSEDAEVTIGVVRG